MDDAQQSLRGIGMTHTLIVTYTDNKKHIGTYQYDLREDARPKDVALEILTAALKKGKDVEANYVRHTTWVCPNKDQRKWIRYFLANANAKEYYCGKNGFKEHVWNMGDKGSVDITIGKMGYEGVDGDGVNLVAFKDLALAKKVYEFFTEREKKLQGGD